MTGRASGSEWGIFFFCLILPALACMGCSRSPGDLSSHLSYRVAYDPYKAVDWESDHRCMTQFHDHVEDASFFYRFAHFYDEAGYQALCPLHYSGNPDLEKSWSKRYWPISRYSGDESDEAFLKQFKNLRILIPGAEEVGYHHILSPFMTEYIEKVPTEGTNRKYPFQYESSQACIDRILEYGGLPILAHPWNAIESYETYEGYRAIEIYSGYANHHFATGRSENTNTKFLKLWDHLLQTHSTRIWGIAVNDWFGPGRFDLAPEFPAHVDTGKTVLLIKDWTLESLRESFEQGAFLAIQDRGLVKGEFPKVERIEVEEDRIRVETDSEVSWIANQTCLATGEVFVLSNLPPDLHYIRPQIRNATGEVFIQPFTLEPRNGA